MAVLAKALMTIDHVSGGRMECGLGAGWHEQEFAAYGIPFLPIRDRLDQLEEAAQIVRSLFDAERTTFRGKHFQLDGAYAAPKPVQPRPRLWIGGEAREGYSSSYEGIYHVRSASVTVWESDTASASYFE